MLGYWPPEYKDELFYSLCARYRERCDISNAAVSLTLFGVQRINNVFDYPCRLDHLRSEMPSTFETTSSDLIWANTLLPFFMPFMSARMTEAAVARINGSKSYSTAFATRLRGPSAAPVFLRYCPECVVEERNSESREAYWHRLHQLRCVLVCPAHKVFLVNSKLRRTQATPQVFVSAERTLAEVQPPVRIDTSDPRHSTLLWLAEQADWLLTHRTPALDRSEVTRTYLHHLTAAGFAAPSGMIHFGQFNSEIVSTFGVDLLTELDCMIGQGRSPNTWSYRVVRGPECAHPIQHLLILRFLGIGISDFVSQVGKLDNFEPGPWPCLNPVCENYGKDVVRHYELRIHGARMYGVFACDCGFSYARRGPDFAGNTRSSPFRVVSTGSEWDRELTDLWNQSDVSLAQIASKLSTSPYKIKQTATRLGLTFSRAGREITPSEPLSREFLRVQYRRDLLRFLASHPHATRSTVHNEFMRQSRWLRENDREWFFSNLPDRKRTCARSQRSAVDWIARDRTLSKRVTAISEQFYADEACPRRVTRNRILKALVKHSALYNASRLPKTVAALNKNVESPEQHALRRLTWLLSQSQRRKGRGCKYSRLVRTFRPEWCEKEPFRKLLALAKQRMPRVPQSSLDDNLVEIAGATAA